METLNFLLVSQVYFILACFSILASGPHLDATITSENILRRSSIDNVVDHLCNASLVLEDFFSRSFQDSAYNQMFRLSFIVVFFWVLHYEKTLGRFSVKYRPFLEDPTWSDLFPLCSYFP